MAAVYGTGSPPGEDWGAALAGLLSEGPSPTETRAVSRNSEFERILALPRRRWREDDPEIQKLCDQLTAWLKTPHGTQRLRPAQAVALAELFHHRALFGMLRVGSGKTLVSFLAATVLGAERAVLVLPAKLKKKTLREFTGDEKGRERAEAERLGVCDAEAYRKALYTHWRGPAALRIVTYEELSRDYGGDDAQGNDTSILGIQNPELIILEECHRAKDVSAACTKKLAFHMRRHPSTRVVALSGTVTKRSVRDYAHILYWCLKGRAPFPRHHPTQVEWAGALDEKVRQGERVDPGALVQLATDEDWTNKDGTRAEPQTAARRGYRRRLTETPGVVAYSKKYDGASLLIDEFPEPKYSQATEDAFAKLRTECKLPDGSPSDGGMDNWRIERQLAVGFYGIWDPWPPEEWYLKRKAWHAAERSILGGNPWRLDSAFQVANLCAKPPMQGDTPRIFAAKIAYREWVAVRDAPQPDTGKPFAPNFRPVWIDDALLKAVAKWMANNKGLVWVEHVAFAGALAKMTGASYFGAQGEDARGRAVEDARPAKDGSIILSIESNIEGRNLQEWWSDNLITTSIKGGDKMEQLLGRTLRDGQTSDEVEAHLYFGCRANLSGWLQNIADCHYEADSAVEDAMILTCDRAVPTTWEELEARAPSSARYW